MTGNIPMIDYDRLHEVLRKFYCYAAAKDGRENDPGYQVSFKRANGYLYVEEGYKAQVHQIALDLLHYNEWTRSTAGTGSIAANMLEALQKCKNLVYWNQIQTFSSIAQDPEKRIVLENALYEIYCGGDAAAAFQGLIDVIGAKYDLIAYIMYLKDHRCYLPVSPGNFDQALDVLNIEHKLSYNCSWDNYCTFNAIVAAILDEMDRVLPKPDNTTFDLIDAHSFLWIIGQKDFLNFNANKDLLNQYYRNKDMAPPEAQTPKIRQHMATEHRISKKLRDYVLHRAHGICQLCTMPAPFMSPNGEPYLEVHHIYWVAHGGIDDVKNLVALCPNCHTKMHIRNDEEDVKKLKAVSSEKSCPSDP